jgi:hypothetical protein
VIPVRGTGTGRVMQRADVPLNCGLTRVQEGAGTIVSAFQPDAAERSAAAG